MPLPISIHAAREGGDCYHLFRFDDFFISIHAAREGGDAINIRVLIKSIISIHAAREGGDHVAAQQFVHIKHFNPRRP